MPCQCPSKLFSCQLSAWHGELSGSRSGLRFTSLVAQGPDYDELARRVAEAAADANTALEVAGALQQAAGEPDEDPIGPLICAFNYDPVSPRNTDRREQHGAFAPIVEWDGQQFPPPLGDIDNEWLTVTTKEANSCICRTRPAAQTHWSVLAQSAF
jgi:hypothetical protein